jgi:hypothetical protein
MQFTLSIIIGVLAAIGLLTIIAVVSVIRFGDDALSKIKQW